MLTLPLLFYVSKSHNHRTEYDELEEDRQNHQVQLLAFYRTPHNHTMGLRALSKHF